MAHIRQAAHNSQVTACGLSAHLGQWTQSMQKGRWEPRIPDVQDRPADSSSRITQALDESALMGSDTDDFMAMAGGNSPFMAPNRKMRYGQTCPYWRTFFAALRTATTRVKSFHVSVNQG
jgi:hypothetical protein